MHKKGNISLLVLFVLVACSLLGILAVQYTRHMAIQTSQIYNYYKAYYLAKGANEIGLSLIKLRWAGYSLEIHPTDTFVQQNILTGNAFSLIIQGESSLLSQEHPNSKECNQPLLIPWNKSTIFPLFVDSAHSWIANNFTEQYNYKNKSNLLKTILITGLETPRPVSIGIIISSWWITSDLGIFFMSGIFQGYDFFEILKHNIQQSFNATDDRYVKNREEQFWLQNYLIIANTSPQDLRFCLQLPDNKTLPFPKTYISSFGYAWTKKIGIETIYQQPIPSYLIDSNLQFSE